jgi:pimeloyl-ACP methyl ester carboxylesterase
VVTATDGVALHADVHGEGTITVVLAHGWALGRSTWDEVADALVDAGTRVVRYDQRGHGRSERGETSALTLSQLGLDLAAVIEQLGGAGPVVVVGHSMGGMALMAMVRQRPDLIATRIAAVALVSSSAGELRDVGLMMPKPLRPIAARAIAPVMAHVHVRTHKKEGGVLVRLADRLTRRSTFGARADAVQVAAARRLIAATDPEVIRGCSRAMAEHDEVEALVALRGVPVRVLVGSRDVLTPLAHARRVATETGARLVVVPEAGHMLHVEAPDVVVAELLDLVRSTAHTTVDAVRRTPAGAAGRSSS